MSTLRSKLIKLAYQKPDLRSQLLPVLAAYGEEEEEISGSPALEIVTAGIALLIAQSAILNNPFYTEGEVRKFLAQRRALHRDFVAACLQFADECEEGKYGPALKATAIPLRAVSKLTPAQDQQALVLVARVLRGLRMLRSPDTDPLLLRLIRQAITIETSDEEREPGFRYGIDYIRFFKDVLRLGSVPAGVKVLLRKVILLGKGDGRSLTLGLTPHEEENPGAWFDMAEEEKSNIRNAVNESERIWKDAVAGDKNPELVQAAWKRSQTVLKDAQRRAGVHLNIIRGAEGKEPVEDVLKRESKMEVNGPTEFLLDKLRKSYEKWALHEKKNMPREQRKLFTLLNKAKTLETYQRLMQDAVDRGIVSAGSGLLEDIQNGMRELEKNKAVREGIPLAPLTWKPMSVEEFQAAHDTGEIEFQEDLPEERKREILGRVSRAVSDLEKVFGKGFCGKHEKKLIFSFGSGGGFMAKASYFAWDDKSVWQPRVKFGEEYEGVLAHELSHYLDDLLHYKLEQKFRPEATSRYHGNLMGNTGVELEYTAKTFNEGASPFYQELRDALPEIPELLNEIIKTPDFARWKNKLGNAHDIAYDKAVKKLTGQSMYDLPKDHPFNYDNLSKAQYKSDLPPDFITEVERQYNQMMGGDDRKLRYYYSSVEVWARVCEQYVYHKLVKQGISNPWLNWMTYDDDLYIEEKTFEEKIEPIMDRLFSRLKDQKMLASVVRRFMSGLSLRATMDPATIAAKLTPQQRKILLLLHQYPLDSRHPSSGSLPTKDALFRMGLLNKVVEIYPKGIDPMYVDPMRVRKPLILTNLGHEVANLILQSMKKG